VIVVYQAFLDHRDFQYDLFLMNDRVIFNQYFSRVQMAYQDYPDHLDSKVKLVYQVFQVVPDQKELQVREK
jgi:hypothetical protein